MALFHFTVDQMKRSEGQSAIASAAYRSGERLYSEYYGEYSDYTRKGGVICSDILLPSHAPPEFADRQTLWNAVEQVERGKKAQLAYSFEIALQNEFTIEENIALARQFLLPKEPHGKIPDPAPRASCEPRQLLISRFLILHPLRIHRIKSCLYFSPEIRCIHILYIFVSYFLFQFIFMSVHSLHLLSLLIALL